MKVKYSIIDKLTIALIVITSFYYLEPFFIWETFANGFFRDFLGMIPYRTLFCVAIIVIWVCFYSRKFPKSRKKICLCIGVLMVAICTVFFSGGISNSQIFSMAWLPYLFVVSFLLFPEKIQVKSYRAFKTVFAVSLILPIIWYVLSHIGIRIPYSILQSYEKIKVMRFKFYKLYPMASQITSKYDPTYQELHMSGIFDEAGRVGTVAGLILVSEKYRLKRNWRNIVILIGGICSFSLAFYAIGVIYYVISSLKKRNYKIVVLISVLLIGYIVFVNLKFENPDIAAFQERFIINENGLSGDNRANPEFDKLMSEYYSSDWYYLLFGKGDGAIGVIQNEKNIDGSSYKCFIYNFGFLGFGLSIVWLVLYALYRMHNKGSDRIQIISILIIYIANIYQRPSIFYMGYMIIMFGGMIIASKPDIEEKNKVIKTRRLARVKNCSIVSDI